MNYTLGGSPLPWQCVVRNGTSRSPSPPSRSKGRNASIDESAFRAGYTTTIAPPSPRSASSSSQRRRSAGDIQPTGHRLPQQRGSPLAPNSPGFPSSPLQANRPTFAPGFFADALPGLTQCTAADGEIPVQLSIKLNPSPPPSVDIAVHTVVTCGSAQYALPTVQLPVQFGHQVGSGRLPEPAEIVPGPFTRGSRSTLNRATGSRDSLASSCQLQGSVVRLNMTNLTRGLRANITLPASFEFRLVSLKRALDVSGTGYVEQVLAYSSLDITEQSFYDASSELDLQAAQRGHNDTTSHVALQPLCDDLQEIATPVTICSNQQLLHLVSDSILLKASSLEVLIQPLTPSLAALSQMLNQQQMHTRPPCSPVASSSRKSVSFRLNEDSVRHSDVHDDREDDEEPLTTYINVQQSSPGHNSWETPHKKEGHQRRHISGWQVILCIIVLLGLIGCIVSVAS
ncbi:hypothetical protein DIPPA_18934 [Diplonema papillatum]|nr:hypothetical protein DIPPA_18934 [Diplonema papillatum]